MAAINKFYWRESGILFKNSLNCARDREARAVFLNMVSPFLLSKVFPEAKLKKWAIKCGLIRKNFDENEKCLISMEFIDFLTTAASSLCMLLRYMAPDMIEISRQLKQTRTLDDGIDAVKSSSLFLHLCALFPGLISDNKAFPGLITIFLYMYEKIQNDVLDDPIELDSFLHISAPSEENRLKGNEMFKKQSYKDAIDLYTLAIKESPFAAVLYSNRSISHLKLKSHQKALRDARLALMINPMWPKVYYRLAEVIDHISSPNDAYDTLVDGLRVCVNHNLNGKEVDQLNKFRHSIVTKVKMTPWDKPEILKPDVSKSEVSSSEDKGVPHFLDYIEDLIKSYSIVLERCLYDKSEEVDDNKICNIKIGLSYALNSRGSKEDLNRSITLAESLIKNADLYYQIIGYFLNASSLYKLFQFKKCQTLAEIGLRLINLNSFENWNILHWMDSEIIIDITTPRKLRAAIENLVLYCDHPIPPTAICRYSDSRTNSKHRSHSMSEIYDLELDYKGFIQIFCTEKCRFQYHVNCWKYLKDDLSCSNDKDFLSTKCTTPDCTGAIYQIFIVNKENYKSFVLSKEEAKMKLEKKLQLGNSKVKEPKPQKKSQKVNNVCASSDVCDDANKSILDLLSKVESLSQNFHLIVEENKEIKSELKTHKSLIDKMQDERKKLQDDCKALKNEQKAWKTEKLRFEKDILNLKSELVSYTSAKDNKLAFEALSNKVQLNFQTINSTASDIHDYQTSIMKQKKELGEWMLTWAVTLAECKVNILLQGNNPEEQVKHALKSLQVLSDKKQAYKMSIEEQISNYEKNKLSSSILDFPIPVSIDIISSLLKDVITLNHSLLCESKYDLHSNAPSSRSSSVDSPEPNGLKTNALSKPSATPFFNNNHMFFVESLEEAQSFKNKQKAQVYQGDKTYNDHFQLPQTFSVLNPNKVDTPDGLISHISGNHYAENSASKTDCDRFILSGIDELNRSSPLIHQSSKLPQSIINPGDFATNSGDSSHNCIDSKKNLTTGNRINVNENISHNFHNHLKSQENNDAANSSENGNIEHHIQKQSTVSALDLITLPSEISKSSHPIGRNTRRIHSNQNEEKPNHDTIDVRGDVRYKQSASFGGDNPNKKSQEFTKDANLSGSPSNKGHRQRLFMLLSRTFPGYTYNELNSFVVEVRKNNNNSLTGLTLENITSKVHLIISKISKANEKKTTPKAPWFNSSMSMKPQWDIDNGSALECSICQEDMSTDIEKLGCGHNFHKNCIEKWLKKQKSCPNCRDFALPKADFPALS